MLLLDDKLSLLLEDFIKEDSYFKQERLIKKYDDTYEKRYPEIYETTLLDLDVEINVPRLELHEIGTSLCNTTNPSVASIKYRVLADTFGLEYLYDTSYRYYEFIMYIDTGEIICTTLNKKVREPVKNSRNFGLIRYDNTLYLLR